MTAAALKAPFPWFGGKSRVAHIVWDRFGGVANYVEPFAGSLAVLLGRPDVAGAETVNDLDCTSPDNRVLMADLTWRRAGDLRPDDPIIAFDEHNGEASQGLRAPKRYRHWRYGKVLAIEFRKRPSYRLRFSDGTEVVASENHLWLGGSHCSGGRGWRWQTTKGLVCNRRGQRSWLLKLCQVHQQEQSYEGGWIGGFFDGEGNLAGAPGWRCVAAQNPGVVFDRANELLRQRGFCVSNPETHRKTQRIEINGGTRKALRFLMTFRPLRLLTNFEKFLPSASLYGRDHQAVALVEKEYLGETEVVAVETNARTYVVEGLASHNCYLANFWRALAADPEAVASWADWPVNEADLHARHLWLVNQANFCEQMKTDPDFHDAKIAGWWVWGICQWIGSGWCSHPEWTGRTNAGSKARGIFADRTERRLPMLGSGGNGVHRTMPNLGDSGRGINRGAPLYEYMDALAARLRRVRVCCGDWKRVLGPSPTYKHGLTGIFLDPPYASERDADIYNHDSFDVAHDVAKWAIANGDNSLLRIALCGYEGEHAMPESWECVPWKAPGGYGSQSDAGRGRENASKERIWFSPYCLRQESLFA